MAHSVRIKMAGICIVFSSDMEVDTCHLRTLFKHHLCDDSYENNICHTVEIITKEKSPLPEGAHLTWKGYYHGVGYNGKHENTVKKYIDDNKSAEYFVTTDGSCIINDMKRPHTTCALLSKRKMLKQEWVRANIGSIIILLVHLIMARHNRYTLHASAVKWNGKAIVFTGKSGQGKSTLCVDLVAQGAGFLGDDIVFAFKENNQVMIAPLLFDAKLFINKQSTKSFIDITEKYGKVRTEGYPLQAIAQIKQTRKGVSKILSIGSNDDKLFDVLLEATNNLALQYNHDDWLELCACILHRYKLFTFYFGDRRLLHIQLLNEFSCTSDFLEASINTCHEVP